MNKDQIFAYLISSLIMIFFYAALWTCDFCLSLKLFVNGFLVLAHIGLFTELLDD
jgi:hypothetical protein